MIQPVRYIKYERRGAVAAGDPPEPVAAPVDVEPGPPFPKVAEERREDGRARGDPREVASEYLRRSILKPNISLSLRSFGLILRPVFTSPLYLEV